MLASCSAGRSGLGFVSCSTSRSDLGSLVSSRQARSLRCSRHVGFAADGAARVDQVGWQYGASTKSGLLEGGAAPASRSLSSGSFETVEHRVGRG